MSTSKELVKENSTYVNEIQSVDREKQELRRTEERLHASEKSVEEVEELITQNREIVASEIYLKPKYIEVLSIPRRVVEVVEQFQALMKEDIYGRLVQVCQFSYPSPVPLVRAIIDLYNEEWTTVFDENPYACLLYTSPSPRD